jgi:hypothetical protein
MTKKATQHVELAQLLTAEGWTVCSTQNRRQSSAWTFLAPFAKTCDTHLLLNTLETNHDEAKKCCYRYELHDHAV